MSNKYFNKKFYVKTLTPIFIGTDSAMDYSPYTDFIQSDDSVKIIDKKLFEKHLSSKPELIDKYVSGVKDKIYNNRSNFDLKNFIQKELQIDADEIIKTEILVPHSDRSEVKKRNVKAFINTNGKAFIPGSSIKGAIKTALYYSFLMDTKEGSRLLNTFMDMIRRNEKIKDISKFDFDSKILPNDEFGFDARFLRVRDTKHFEDDNKSVRALHRINLNNNNPQIPQVCECVNENSVTNFEIQFVRSFQSHLLKELNESKIDHLFEMINNFSMDFLEFEIDRLKHSQNVNEVEYLITWYNNLQAQIKKNNPHAAFFRVGQGKTYFDNSVGLAIYQTDKKLFNKYREKAGLGKNPKTKKIVKTKFPATRTVYNSNRGNLPVGWIGIAEEENKDKLNIEETKKQIEQQNNNAYSKLSENFKVSKL